MVLNYKKVQRPEYSQIYFETNVLPLELTTTTIAVATPNNNNKCVDNSTSTTPSNGTTVPSILITDTLFVYGMDDLMRPA